MRQRQKTALLPLLLCVIAVMALSGCGIKPGEVEAPSGAEQSRFPHTYPNPVFDRVPAQP